MGATPIIVESTAEVIYDIAHSGWHVSLCREEHHEVKADVVSSKQIEHTRVFPAPSAVSSPSQASLSIPLESFDYELLY